MFLPKSPGPKVVNSDSTRIHGFYDRLEGSHRDRMMGIKMKVMRMLYMRIFKQQNRNSANLGTTLFPIPNFSLEKHNFRGPKSVVSRSEVWGGIKPMNRLTGVTDRRSLAPARTAIGELSY